MANTLDLDPEWGAIDLIEEVEETFGFKIEDEEAERCETVGDLYAIIRAHSPDWDIQDGKCASSMAFYRLRNAIDAETRPKITPQTPLFRGTDGVFALFSALSKSSGLRLPNPELTRLGIIGSYLLTAGIIGGIVMLLVGQWKVSAVAAVVVASGLFMVRLDPGKLPANVATVGDLARRAAALSSAKLKEAGGRPADRWAVLVSLAAEHGSLAPEDIGPDTFLHRKSLELATAR